MGDEQVLAIHGYATIPFDHASLPSVVWDELKVLPNGCWVVDMTPQAAASLRKNIFQRITKRNKRDLFSITPTCANVYCVNPAHTCVTVKNALSKGEEGRDGNDLIFARRAKRIHSERRPVGAHRG